MHILLAIFSVLAFLSPPSFAENTPSDAIKLFYQLVSKQQCSEAVKIRPNYTVERCKKVTKTHIYKVTTELSDDKNAVILLELDSFLEDKKNYFFGYVKLIKKNHKWIITGPFKNREDYWLDEYIDAYIPEGIKGEAVEEETLDSPVKKSASKQVSTQIKKVSPKQQITEPPKAPIKRNTKKTETTPPPGDSIDADEFKEPNKYQAIQSEKKHPNSTVEKLTTAEANKFMLGEYAIEGNYTALLRKIRKNFPQEAISNILLIDQSRNTIYIYNNTDLLLAFFPILSSDNSSFPSGLYRINSQNSLELNDQKEHLENQSITLEKVQKIILPESNPTSKQRAEQKQYYIRDLFDADKNNSILLSPIDNTKLRQLILPSTIVYKGQ